ncbi:MAG TPA: hypothetical protein VGF99_03085, partial [Myxococcota bacterium]
MNLVDAVATLRAQLRAGGVGMVTVPRLSTAALLQLLRAVDVGERAAVIDAGNDSPAATIAFGVAAIGEGPPARAVQALLSSSRERVVMIAAPFAPAATRSAWAPRVWLRQGTNGDATLGVDVVDRDVEAATQMLDVAGQPSHPTSLSLRGRGAPKL